MAARTSNVLQEEKKTQVKQTQLFEERESMQKTVGMLQERLTVMAEEIEDTEIKIQMKNQAIKKHIVRESIKTSGVGILSSLVPYFSSLVSSIYRFAAGPSAAGKTHVLNAELSELKSEKGKLLHEQHMLQVRQIIFKLKLSSSKYLDGENINLQDAHNSLSQIQKILVQLKKFWEKTGFELKSLKDKTFVNEFLTDDPDMKDEFLESIEIAGKYWSDFCNGCERAQCFFSIQSKNAYNFLDTNPSTLSEDEWNKEHEFVTNKLFRISSQGSSTAAITAQQHGLCIPTEVSKDFKGSENTIGGPAPRMKFNLMWNPSDLTPPPLTGNPKETPTKSLPPPPPYEKHGFQNNLTVTPTNLPNQQLQSYQTSMTHQTSVTHQTSMTYQPTVIHQVPVTYQPQVTYQPLVTYQPPVMYQPPVTLTFPPPVTYQPQVIYQPQVTNQSQMIYQSQMTYQSHTIYK